MKNRRESKGKSIRPTFFVFCEGESEETYIKYLRSKYRLPIEIDPRVVGLNITTGYINNYKKSKSTHPKDKDFLIYDLDREEILKRLLTINNAVVITSNPCFELWYLLHYMNQTALLTADDCCEKLSRFLKTYKKGSMCPGLLSKLHDEAKDALSRARKLKSPSNPSTEVYKFIDELDKAAKE